MPDVFVAQEKQKNEDLVMHKRTPAETKQEAEPIVQPTSKPQEIPTPQLLEKTEIAQPKQEAAQQEKPAEKHMNASAEEIMQEEEHRNAIPLFTSFWQNPQGVYFDTQEANEHILLFLRRHFVTNIPWIFTTIIFALLPIGFGYFVQLTRFSFATIPPLFAITTIVMYYLVVITAGFLRFLDWYFNISLITARRVMDIELKDLVYKKISATKISLVQDVNFQQTGTIRTVFNYGEVLVQTAGATDNFFINAVPHPEVVVQVMEELIGKGEEEQENASV